MNDVVLAAAESNNARELLTAMRNDLAAAMDAADPAVKAQLSGQLLKVVSALQALPDDQGTIVDDLAKRRADRVAKARAPAPAKRKIK